LKRKNSKNLYQMNSVPNEKKTNLSSMPFLMKRKTWAILKF